MNMTYQHEFELILLPAFFYSGIMKVQINFHTTSWYSAHIFVVVVVVVHLYIPYPQN